MEHLFIYGLLSVKKDAVPQNYLSFLPVSILSLSLAKRNVGTSPYILPSPLRLPWNELQIVPSDFRILLPVALSMGNEFFVA